MLQAPPVVADAAAAGRLQQSSGVPQSWSYSSETRAQGREGNVSSQPEYRKERRLDTSWLLSKKTK